MRQIEIFNQFKVGFNHRTDTYTDKLGFINPLMQEANGRKKEKYKYAKSYENWRSQKIDEEFYDNEPISGFIVNYRVGGHYSYFGELGREPKVRILDPRGFEIEITLENLIEILEFGVSAGKLIEGEYQYVFRDKHLTLVNINSLLYKEIFSSKTTIKEFDKKDVLVFGHIYQTSDLGSEVGKHIYIGKQYHFNKGKHKNGYGKVELVDTFIKYTEYTLENLKKYAKTFKPYSKPYDYVKTNVKKSEIKYDLGKFEYDLDVVLYYKHIYYCGFDPVVNIDSRWEGYNYPSKLFKPLDFKTFKPFVNGKTNFVVNYTDNENMNDHMMLDLSNISKKIIDVTPSAYYSYLYIYNDVAHFFKYNNNSKLNVTPNGNRLIITDKKNKIYEVSNIIDYENETLPINILTEFIENGGEIKKIKFVRDEFDVMVMVYDGNVTIDEINKNKWYSVNGVFQKNIKKDDENPLMKTYLNNKTT